MDAAPQPPTQEKTPFWLRAAVILLVLAGIALTAYFGVRVLRGAARFHAMRMHPMPYDVSQIRPWMTLPYLSRAYHVPEDLLWQGLRIPSEPNRHKSLEALERIYTPGQTGTLVERVRAIIHDYQAQHPTPTPLIPPPGKPPALYRPFIAEVARG